MLNLESWLSFREETVKGRRGKSLTMWKQSKIFIWGEIEFLETNACKSSFRFHAHWKIEGLPDVSAANWGARHGEGNELIAYWSSALSFFAMALIYFPCQRLLWFFIFFWIACSDWLGIFKFMTGGAVYTASVFSLLLSVFQGQGRSGWRWLSERMTGYTTREVTVLKYRSLL